MLWSKHGSRFQNSCLFLASQEEGSLWCSTRSSQTIFTKHWQLPLRTLLSLRKLYFGCSCNHFCIQCPAASMEHLTLPTHTDSVTPDAAWLEGASYDQVILTLLVEPPPPGAAPLIPYHRPTDSHPGILIFMCQ